MKRIEIQIRRRSAVGLVLASVALLPLAITAPIVSVLKGSRPQGAADLMMWVLAGVISMIYGLLPTFGIITGVRVLLGVATPRAVVDERGLTFPVVGLIEWADVRGADVVRRKKRGPRVRIEVQNWEKYYWRQPGWARRLDRQPASGETRPIDLLLEHTGVEPEALCDTIRREAERRRRQAV
jgi:hypothetical protein